MKNKIFTCEDMDELCDVTSLAIPEDILERMKLGKEHILECDRCCQKHPKIALRVFQENLINNKSLN